MVSLFFPGSDATVQHFDHRRLDQRLPDAHEAPVDDAAITESFAPGRQEANGPIRCGAQVGRSSWTRSRTSQNTWR